MRARHGHKRRSSCSCREHVLSKKLNGLPMPAKNADLCYPDKASFEKGDREEGRTWLTAMRCRSIDHTSRSLHPPVRSNSKFLRRSIRLSMLACNSHLREKPKSPKPSLREESSPPRYTANNQKCSESHSGSPSGALCLAPFRTLTHALPVFMQVIYCTEVGNCIAAKQSIQGLQIQCGTQTCHLFRGPPGG